MLASYVNYSSKFSCLPPSLVKTEVVEEVIRCLGLNDRIVTWTEAWPRPCSFGDRIRKCIVRKPHGVIGASGVRYVLTRSVVDVDDRGNDKNRKDSDELFGSHIIFLVLARAL
jgi:hypothetical protein